MKQTVSKQLAISEVYDLYLKAFAKLHFLTAKQLTALFYKMGMLTTVQARLKLLTDCRLTHKFGSGTLLVKAHQ